jgi:hypothetical protein
MNEYDPHQINADLHCHSVVSDGTLLPVELAQRALEGGVEMWSLTDHDEVGGQEAAEQAALALGIRYVPGVEISVTWADDTVHIVGLQIDYRNQTLLNGLTAVRQGRELRAREMGQLLAKEGIPGTFEGALRYVGNPDLISRTHFARYLVEIGLCADIRDVFHRYLVPGKPGYVPHRWAKLTEAIAWIKAAGGIAVLAHPGRYKISELMLHTLIEEFVAAGGEGIEVVTGSHTVAQYKQFAQLAMHYDLLASRGSDFHGPKESRVTLGTLPPLPDGCIPIWHQWA